MKKLSLLILSIVFLSGVGYGKPLEPVMQPKVILKDFDSFLFYIGAYYKPYQDFISYDAASRLITKKVFLEKLKTGDYLPLRLKVNDGKLYYILYKIDPDRYKKISSYIDGYAYQWLENYEKQGKKFPAFNFTDINGNKYNAANTKGKVLVVKCWFIGCQRCEEEMPELNQLMARHKNRKDIIFISLAPDSKVKLHAFLKRKRFDYPIVAGQNSFIENKLKVTAYPTHLIVNKQGIVVNVVDDPEDIEWALQHRI
ncbi:MAG: TlpA family protein disulfide reductase [Mucilaginibacter sp.]|nr:TlpA family protein disulfide reductase [Mucilaginibacter sp.]